MLKCYVSDETRYCRECAYPLVNLPAPRCPECGSPFDPEDDETYVTVRRDGLHYLVLAVGASVLVTVPALLPAAADRAGMLVAPSVEAALAPLMPVGFLGSVVALHLCWQGLAGPRGALRHRAAAVGALTLSLLVTLGLLTAAVVQLFRRGLPI